MRKDWKYSNFSEIYPIEMGRTPARADNSLWDKKKETHNLWVSIADISHNEGRYITDTEEYVSDKASSKMRLVAKGSLLMSFKLTIGKMAFAGDDLFTNEAIIAIPDNGKYNLRFLYYYLSNYNWSTLTDGAEKVKGKTLNKTSIGKILLPIISLSEQERIVSLLDEQFAKIDALKANAASQLQAAKDLFQSALKQLLTPQEGWEMKTLDEISNDMFRGSGITRDQITNDGISCVRYGEIYTTYNYWFNKCKSHTDESKIKSPKYFENGDILFTITGESVEDIAKCVAYLGVEKCLAGGDIVVMKHNQNAKYLSYALSTPDAIKQKGLGKTKLKVVHSNIPSIKSIVVPIPSLPEQERIAARLDTISEKVKALQANYDQTITLCNDLKQSLLKSIFA